MKKHLSSGALPSSVGQQAMSRFRRQKQGYYRLVAITALIIFAMIVTVMKTISSHIVVRQDPQNSYYGLTSYSSSLAEKKSKRPGSRSSISVTVGGQRLAVESTGKDLHLSVCGQTWNEYFFTLPRQTQRETRPFQWTVSGGDEYRANAKDILSRWKELGMNPVLVVAMDSETAEAICRQGFSSVHWSAPSKSYSRIADAKFAVASAIAEKGYQGFFIEMDVFCRKNPVPFFLKQSQKYDLVNIGHGDVNFNVNIGVFMASSRMSPFFAGMSTVLTNSLQHELHFKNQRAGPLPFFDQDIYRDCLPVKETNEDDGVPQDRTSYYSEDDLERKTNLLEACQQWDDFDFITLPHHIMSAHDPPTIYDSTYCIHPLASRAFTPLAFKLGVAKFYGWDPKPIGRNEKLLKLLAGDFEFNTCWNRCFPHEETHLKEGSKAREVVSTSIAAMVEIAVQTGRTLVLPQYVRTDDAWAVPTHTLVDVRSLGVPYRVMTREDAYRIEENTQVVVKASRTFDATLADVLDENYANAKVLAIDRFCNVQDHMLPLLEERKSKIKWCLFKELKWSRAIGNWMDFCGARDDDW